MACGTASPFPGLAALGPVCYGARGCGVHGHDTAVGVTLQANFSLPLVE